MKKWKNRVLMAICAMFFMLSVFGNIAQNKQVLSLQRELQIQTDRKKTLAEEAETLQEKLEQVRRDCEYEAWLREIVQRDYKVLAEATYEVAEQKAIEEGFNQEELDWFINGEGHWCFWYYPEDI